MRYTCRYCDWVYDGYSKTGEIIIHERTHPENSIDNIIPTTSVDVKIKCRTCGCDEDHTKEVKYNSCDW